MPTEPTQVLSGSAATVPDVMGSWSSSPQLNGFSPAQALDLYISTQLPDGRLEGTVSFYGDGLLAPTVQGPVYGTVQGTLILLSGSGVSLRGTYSLTMGASISFTAEIGSTSFAGELFEP